MRNETVVLYIALAVVGATGSMGCTTTGASRSAEGGRHHLTAEQVRAAAERYHTAYEIIESLRPLWLRKRGQSSIMNETEIAVYVDGTRYGTPEDLRSITAIAVDSMRFLPPSEATNRYGTGHVHGIIMVYTRR